MSQNRDAKATWTPIPAAPPHDTFWTACRECNFKHEYLRKFCSQIIICPSCSKPFIAVEIAATINFSETAKPVPWPRWKHSNRYMPSLNAYDSKCNVAAAQKPGPGPTTPNSSIYTNSQQGPLHGTTNTHSRYPSFAEKPDNIIQQAHDNLKRSRL